MKSHILYRRIAVCVSFLLIGVFQSLLGAGLTYLGTYNSSHPEDSGLNDLPAGSEITNISPWTVGTDGSVAFVINIIVGGTDLMARLYWLDSAFNDLADDEVPNNEWVEDAQLQPVAIRKNHLIYLNDGQLHSMTRDGAGVVTDVAVGSPLADTQLIAPWMNEQSRSPGVLYLIEAGYGSDVFKLHAYAIDPVSTVELQTPTVIGIQDSSVEGERVIHLEFPTVAGAVYQLESTTDLINWAVDGAQVDGNDANILTQRPAPASGNIFYRIRKL